MASETPGFTEAVLRDTWREFETARKQVPFELWNESVFRWFFVRSAIKLYPKSSYPNVEYHIEWKHFDLLAHFKDQNRKHLIEFKFFVRNRRYNLDDTPGSWKGGPGTKNFEEFRKCVRKLKEVEQPREGQFDERSLILVFPHHENGPARRATAIGTGIARCAI